MQVEKEGERERVGLVRYKVYSPNKKNAGRVKNEKRTIGRTSVQPVMGKTILLISKYKILFSFVF